MCAGENGPARRAQRFKGGAELKAGAIEPLPGDAHRVERRTVGTEHSDASRAEVEPAQIFALEASKLRCRKHRDRHAKVVAQRP